MTEKQMVSDLCKVVEHKMITTKQSLNLFKNLKCDNFSELLSKTALYINT